MPTRPKRRVIPAGQGPSPGLTVPGLARHASPARLRSWGAPGHGLLCRASVIARTRSVGETSGAATVRVEESPGVVAAAGSACGWPGGFERPETGVQMEPGLVRWSPSSGSAAAREEPYPVVGPLPLLPNCWEKPVGLWLKLGPLHFS